MEHGAQGDHICGEMEHGAQGNHICGEMEHGAQGDNYMLEGQIHDFPWSGGADLIKGRVTCKADTLP